MMCKTAPLLMLHGEWALKTCIALCCLWGGQAKLASLGEKKRMQLAIVIGQDSVKGSRELVGITPIKPQYVIINIIEWNNRRSVDSCWYLGQLAKSLSAIMESGDLEYLVKHNFNELPLQQQLWIKSDGRPTPNLELCTERKKGLRTFNEENYDHIDCAVKLKLFGRIRINKSLDLAKSLSTKKHNEQVKKIGIF